MFYNSSVFIEMQATYYSMFYRATSGTRVRNLRIYSGLVKEWRQPLPAYNVSMAAPLDGFDANTYRPRSPCWITPLSILDL